MGNDSSLGVFFLAIHLSGGFPSLAAFLSAGFFFRNCLLRGTGGYFGVCAWKEVFFPRNCL